MFSMVGLYICFSVYLDEFVGVCTYLIYSSVHSKKKKKKKKTNVHAVRYSHSPRIMAWHGIKVQKIQEYS